MKKGHFMMAALVLMALCSCGEKKQAAGGRTVHRRYREVRHCDRL